MNNEAINSKAYWENRFMQDWDSAGGPQQARYFARLAVENLPPWFSRLAHSEALTICDWGCAEGDGTDILATYFGRDNVCGVDFAEKAIEIARYRYQDLEFTADDWAADETVSRTFDVVFSSNTLEHFVRPYEILTRIAKRADKFIVLLLPYREFDRHPEHYYTFVSENIPVVFDHDFVLVYSKVVDVQPPYWYGQQIVLIYARKQTIQTAGLQLADISLTNERSEEALTSLRGLVAERDGQIASLNQAVAERDKQIASLNQALTQRETEIMNIKKSTSWRITAPLRFLKECIFKL